MTENELRINGKSFDETISLIEEFMESDDVHGELFTVLRSARDFMENLNEEIQQYRAIGLNPELIEAMQGHNIALINDLGEYQQIGTIEEFKALKEKSVAKKPITYTHTHRADCPNCKATVRGINNPFGDYCSKCGIRLDWSE